MQAFHEILPDYVWSAAYSVRVRASLDRTFAAISTADFGTSRYIRLMFMLRGLPRARLTIDGFLAAGQCVLVREAPREITLGLLARPWQTSGVWRPITADEFFAMDEPGGLEGEFVRIIWGFRVFPDPGTPDGCRLMTETRIVPTDEVARRRFGRYWTWIAPHSGWVRRSMLQAIRKTAEASVV